MRICACRESHWEPAGGEKGDALPGLGDVSDVTIEVSAGKETVVDLTARPVPAWMTKMVRQINITVEQNGKLIGGAEVALFSDEIPAEEIKRRFEVWKAAKTRCPEEPR